MLRLVYGKLAGGVVTLTWRQSGWIAEGRRRSHDGRRRRHGGLTPPNFACLLPTNCGPHYRSTCMGFSGLQLSDSDSSLLDGSSDRQFFFSRAGDSWSAARGLKGHGSETCRMTILHVAFFVHWWEREPK